MRTLLGTILAASLLAGGCSENQAPRISSLETSGAIVPRNGVATLSAVASDPDGDSLSYEWQAPAGVFSAGSQAPNVTWVPPQTETDYQIRLSISDGKTTTDTTIMLRVGKAVYDLSGTISNQSGNPAVGVYVVITDSYAEIDSVKTDSGGDYLFPSVPEGSLMIALRSSETGAFGLKRYKNNDTTVAHSANSVQNLAIRELTTAFSDNGTRPSNWKMSRVRHDGSKYILNHEFLTLADNMEMVTAVRIPRYARDVRCFIVGEAAPADSSYLIVEAHVDGKRRDKWSHACYPMKQTFQRSLESIPQLNGHDLRLRITYEDAGADYVYLHRVCVTHY